jgi:hypothetical protein
MSSKIRLKMEYKANSDSAANALRQSIWNIHKSIKKEPLPTPLHTNFIILNK